MKNIIIDFKEYLKDTLGMSAAATNWDGSGRLPVYLRELYRFYEADLLGIRCLIMVARNQDEKTPATIRKHMAQIQEKWDGEVVFVDRAASSYNRKRFIEHKISFVIPCNQMYLPTLGIDLREHFRKLRQIRPTFSPSTQALVLHAIYRGNGQTISPSEMAHRLGYSAMTMTRAFDELESVGLGEHFVKGKERYLRFAISKKSLWEQTLQFVRTPAKKKLNVLIEEKSLKAIRAGISALAHYSMIAEPRNPVYAVSVDEWKIYSRQHKVTELTVPEPGSIEIELWSYSPAQYAANGFADRLSLYLSLKDSNDERIETALEEMMESIQW